MPELLRVSTEHFELTVWCNDIAKRQQTYVSTQQKRAALVASIVDGTPQSPSELRLSPAQVLTDAAILEKVIDVEPTAVGSVSLEAPIFFENMQYQFEWIFLCDAVNGELTHRLSGVNAGFRFAAQKGRIPARLTGTINTGNDVGWMRLPLSFELAGKSHKCDFAFEVLPTKMDLHGDLPVMYRAIDNTYPLWRFSLAEKTEQDAANSKRRGNFPLLWLANFSALRQRFEQGLKVIAQAPHSRLQAKVSYIRADRLKGRLSNRLANTVKEDIGSHIIDKRYRIEKKQLCVDTPENRFIKMVTTKSKNQLSEFENALRQSNKAPDKQRISETFLDELASWRQPLNKMLGQQFMREVGVYKGMTKESLVLQQKTGYSAVYAVWQELKFYLDLFSDTKSASLKSVAEIYEIWCFLTLRNILIDELGFVDVTSERPALVLNEYFEYQLKDGLAGAFEFKHPDGLKAKLAHEPSFGKKTEDIRSYLVSQKPDIVLEVEFSQPSSKRYVWLFDAKYRIKTKDDQQNDSADFETTDYVPEDAINQMHRYRDALIRLTQDSTSTHYSKSRPVFGAFALYPGYFDQAAGKNPYADAIADIGIGAFALLPSDIFSAGNLWLVDFLRKEIGITAAPKSATYTAKKQQDYLYVQEAARIPYYGMKQALYPDLVFTIALAGKTGRKSQYFDSYVNGTANWYHLPVTTFTGKFKQHVVEEIQFLALAVNSSLNPSKKQIDKLWPVKRVVVVPRYTITAEQSGKQSTNSDLYYLFELGKPLTIKDSVQNVQPRPIQRSMKLTTLPLLNQARHFDELESVYEEALVS